MPDIFTVIMQILGSGGVIILAAGAALMLHLIENNIEGP